MPVIAMLFVGWLCRQKKWVSREGVDNIKFLVTKILLLLGYAMKPLNKGKYQKYTPFMVSVYEGGMIGYPLFINLCGNENLSKIAIIDIAGVLFGFSVYMNLLEQVQDGKKSTVKDVCRSAVKNPAVPKCTKCGKYRY